MRATTIFRDWAGMARLPNVPTVWSNVFTAWVLAGGLFAGSEMGRFALAVAGATMMYMGGTVLNDAKDVEFDRQHRPERPIPAGRVSRTLAKWVGWGLGLGGLGAFALTRANMMGNLGAGFSGWFILYHFSAAFSAMALWLCILAYTWVHKKSGMLGPLLMGFCRVLLGVVVAATAEGVLGPVIPWVTALWVYIVAISVIARGEVKVWRRGAVGVMLAGLPLVDAVFLMAGHHYMEVLMPMGCMVLAIGLRKVAEAT